MYFKKIQYKKEYLYIISILYANQSIKEKNAIAKTRK